MSSRSGRWVRGRWRWPSLSRRTAPHGRPNRSATRVMARRASRAPTSVFLSKVARPAGSAPESSLDSRSTPAGPGRRRRSPAGPPSGFRIRSSIARAGQTGVSGSGLALRPRMRRHSCYRRQRRRRLRSGGGHGFLRAPHISTSSSSPRPNHRANRTPRPQKLLKCQIELVDSNFFENCIARYCGPENRRGRLVSTRRG